MPRTILLALLVPALLPAGTTVLFDPLTPSTGPFPSDALTIFDPLQKTGLRIDMPVPDCGATYTACQEGGLLDQLDGFSLRARARVRFSGPVNPATLKDGIFFVALDNLTQEEPGIHKPGDRIAVDQVVYDPATNTALRQAGFRARPAPPLRPGGDRCGEGCRRIRGGRDPAFSACFAGRRPRIARALARGARRGIASAPQKIVAASVFTTMSATPGWSTRARFSTTCRRSSRWPSRRAHFASPT